MIVCDGLDQAGCPAGAVLDVELATRDLFTISEVEKAHAMLRRHGWALGMRESTRRGGGVALEPLCGVCVRLQTRNAGADELAAAAQSLCLQLAAGGDT